MRYARPFGIVGKLIMKVKLAAGVVIAILLAVGFIFLKENKNESKKITAAPTPIESGPTPTQSQKAGGAFVTSMPTNQPPEMQIDISKTYSATLKTSEGNIVVMLTAKETPKTVNNFVALARNNFYNNTIFHRIIKGFMIQGGDPKEDGTGGPGYQFADEPFTGSYTRGTIAMANAGPNTNGSQFFIMHADYDLPKNYVIFGKVTQGLDVVDKIATAPVTMSPQGEESKPVTPVTVTSVEISEK